MSIANETLGAIIVEFRSPTVTNLHAALVAPIQGANRIWFLT